MTHAAAPPLPGLRLRSGALAGFVVALAMGTSSIVFSEPAIADVLMIGVILGVPILAAARLGPVTAASLATWLVFVATGLAALPMATNLETGIIHQLVTLFLALGACVLAAFVSKDPSPRFRLVMIFYVVGCITASLAAYVGYFGIVPGTYDLFTNYGRARGTFKDPNVLGAALAPAITFTVWCTLRSPPARAAIAAATTIFLSLALLITFSRGAWISTAFSLILVAWFALVTSRQQRDIVRYAVVAALGLCALLVAFAAILQMDSVSALLEQRANLDQSYDQGPEGRFGGQQKAINLLLENPFGIGTHTFRDSYHSEEPHSVYLSMFLNAGWLGGMLYILSVSMTLFVGFRGALRASPLQGPFIIAAAAFAGVAFEGFVIDTDHWRHFFILMALVWGLADADPDAVHPTLEHAP
ncbi:MAG: O-antigen ligase family protein [Hyphomicrobium sp.]|jgi:O-antigen ligase